VSLDWDISKVSDETKALWKDESRSEEERDEAWNKAASIIYWCLTVEVGEITSENVADWYTRYKMVSSEQILTLEDVVRMIGLKTNVHTVAPSRWLDRQYEMKRTEVKRALGVLRG
jgi:hypothetical protein